MRKYTIMDFKEGDHVYFIGGSKRKFMPVIEVNVDKCEVTCSSEDSKGLYQRKNYKPSELGKKEDLSIKVITLGNDF